jgi:hypothetical protein
MMIKVMIHSPNDGGRKHLKNVGKLLPQIHGATTQQTAISKLGAVRTRNPTE